MTEDLFHKEIGGEEEKCGKKIAEVTFKYFMNPHPASRNLKDRMAEISSAKKRSTMWKENAEREFRK